MNSISIKGLSVSYDKKIVLTNVYLDIEAGKVYGVIGPNGAGKSTLFKPFLGRLFLKAGKTLINAHPVKAQKKNFFSFPKKEEGVWNSPATVMDIVMMGRYPHKKLFQRMNKQDEEAALAALREIGIENLKNRQIGELSGGQQQRVFLARALCQGANILLLDEPFVGVDITTEEKIISLLKKLAADGKTLLVVHHDLSTVPAYFDKVILINQRLIASGDTDTTFTEENIAKAYGGQLPILQQTGMM